MTVTVADIIAQPLAFNLDLDSDQVEAALAAANLDPQTCTIEQAFDAIAAYQMRPTRGGKRPNSGAPFGNSNGRKPIVRDISLTMRLSQQEYEAIAAATGGKKISTWLREIALAASRKAKSQP